MKYKIIQGEKEIMLVTGLEPFAYGFYFFNDKHKPYLSYSVRFETFRKYNLPIGDWRFLNHVSNITEGQCDMLVKPKSEAIKNCIVEGLVISLYFVDYTTNIASLITPKQSFKTLLKSNGVLFENPYKDAWDELCEWGYGSFDKDGKTSFEIYHESEFNTFRPEETLVFVKD